MLATPRLDVVVDGVPVSLTIENVDPETAERMLLKNTQNRNLKRVAILRFVEDMRTGNWQWTAEPLRFAADGTVIDGQNRLVALIEAGVTLPFLVVRGLPMKAQEDVDTGTPRKFGDVLTLRGEPNATHLAALVRRVAAWERGHRRHLNSTVTSYHALSQTLDAHPELRDYIHPGRKVASATGMTPAVATFAWWLFASIDGEDADFFFARLADGQNLAKGNPIFELRRTLAESKSAKGQRSETYILAITIKAWNAYRAGETVGLYRWKPGGAKPESFPEPK
jgi:hypothetical protein